MMTTQEGYLDVPGAKLYYKLQGSGPVLFTLQGGPGDADGSDGLAAAIGDRYTVISYDRRGLSRSQIDDPAHPIAIGTHSDDASRLLAALTDEPAYLFGSSLGALIALDLAAAHSEQVRLLVAHEAALADLLDEPERGGQLKERQRDVEATFEKAGFAPAMQKLIAIAGGFGTDPDPEAQVQRPAGERVARHGEHAVLPGARRAVRAPLSARHRSAPVRLRKDRSRCRAALARHDAPPLRAIPRPAPRPGAARVSRQPLRLRQPGRGPSARNCTVSSPAPDHDTAPRLTATAACR